MSLRGDHQCSGSGATFERVMSSAVSLGLQADIHYTDTVSHTKGTCCRAIAKVWIFRLCA